MGDYKSALKEFEAIIEKHDKASLEYQYLGLIYEKQKKYGKALEAFKLFIERTPHVTPNNVKGINDVKKRIKDIEQLLRNQNKK